MNPSVFVEKKSPCDVIAENTRIMFTTMKEIKGNPEQFARISRLAINIFGIFSYLANKTGDLGRFFIQLSNNAAVIDLFSVLDAVKFFLAKKYSDATKVEIFGNLCFLGSGVAGIAEISFAFLGEASSAIGKFAVFAGKMSGGFAALAFGCVLLRDIKSLKDAESVSEKHIAFLNMIKDIADISLSIFTLVGTTATGTLLVFGTISAGIGLYVFIFKANKPIEVK